MSFAASPNTRGVIACLGAALLWASNGVVSKYLMNSGLAPFALAQGRITFAAGLTFLWLVFKSPGKLLVNKKDILHFIFLGTIGMAANSGCYLAAVSKIPTAAAILLQYLAPALIALYAWRFMAERMGAIKILALLLAFIGCYLVVGGYNLDLLSLNRWGLAWGLGSAATFAFYCIYSEYTLRNYSTWTVLCYALIMGSIAWNLALGPQQLLNVGWDKRSWLLIFCSASMGTVVPFGIFAYGIDQLRATRATIISTFEPIAAALIAFLFLGEKLELLQMLGGAVVVTAVGLIQREREQDRLAPALIKQNRFRS